MKDSIAEKKLNSDRLLHTMKETKELDQFLPHQKHTTINHMVEEADQWEIRRKQIDGNHVIMTPCGPYAILEVKVVKGYVYSYHFLIQNVSQFINISLNKCICSQLGGDYSAISWNWFEHGESELHTHL